MKTSISIPNRVFEAAEALAKRLEISRSELYTIAVEKYINTHRFEAVTELLNRVYDEQDSSLDK